MKWLPAPTTPPAGPTLRDIHLPPAPPWWPPAPGWWLLAVLLAVALLMALRWWRGQLGVRNRRRRVLAEVDRLVGQHRDDHDQAALVSGLHQMLRRAARQHDANAGRQRGDAWRQTLARMPVDAATLDRLLALDALIYRPSSSFDHAATVSAVQQWLRLALKPSTWKRTMAGPADA